MTNQWRECPYAGETCVEAYARDPDSFHGSEPCEGRQCKLPQRYDYCAYPDDCLLCPVPRLAEELAEAKARLAEAEVLLRRWLDRAKECEGAIMLAHAHGFYLTPTTLGDATRRMLERLHPPEPKGGDTHD